MENKRIFLLGATGQIGKELALELKNTTNFNFLCHSRTSVGSSFFDFYKLKNIVGEIKNENIISEIKIADLIFDLAAPNSGTLKEIKDFYKKRVDLIIPNMRGIMMARQKPLEVLSAKNIKARAIDKKYFKPQEKAEVKLIKPDELDKLIDLLENEAKVI